MHVIKSIFWLKQVDENAVYLQQLQAKLNNAERDKTAALLRAERAEALSVYLMAKFATMYQGQRTIVFKQVNAMSFSVVKF